ncbi:MAG: multiheme c-type cytochrome [Candidatus Electrothrix sp. YB6]
MIKTKLNKMKYWSMALICGAAFCCSSNAYSHELPEGAVPLVKSETCASCHPVIYQEWQESFHANSSALKDPAHGAVHQAFLKAMEQQGKQGNYHCANCHAPMADNLKDLMSGKAELDSSNWTHNEGTGCTFCHRIDSIVEKKMFNQYRLNKDGAFHTSRPVNAKAPHKMAQSALFAEGQVCMGCHSHKLNGKDVPICMMKDEADGNCISCHMSEAEGSPTVNAAAKTHRSHRMPGGHDMEMLEKAATLETELKTEGKKWHLVVTVNNMIKHTFPSTNPMRMAFIKVVAKDKEGNKVWENFTDSPMEDKQALFFKAFKAGEEKGVPSWAADGVAFDTRLKAGESRELTYTLADPSITEVDIILFYRLFPPKAIKGFSIPEDGVNEKLYPVAKQTVTL